MSILGFIKHELSYLIHKLVLVCILIMNYYSICPEFCGYLDAVLSGMYLERLCRWSRNPKERMESLF